MSKTFKEKREMGESSKDSKYVKELKKEIRKLKRENAQMRKRNMRLENLISSEDDETEIKKPIQHPKQQKPIDCPSCGVQNVALLEMRGLIYYKCDECGSKGKLPN